jgi:hypothetical protein
VSANEEAAAVFPAELKVIKEKGCHAEQVSSGDDIRSLRTWPVEPTFTKVKKEALGHKMWKVRLTLMSKQ